MSLITKEDLGQKITYLMVGRGDHVWPSDEKIIGLETAVRDGALQIIIDLSQARIISAFSEELRDAIDNIIERGGLILFVVGEDELWSLSHLAFLKKLGLDPRNYAFANPASAKKYLRRLMF